MRFYAGAPRWPAFVDPKADWMSASRAICGTARLGGLRPGECTHRRRRRAVAGALRHRREADLSGRRRCACSPAVLRPPGGPKPLPVRMLRSHGLLVDLPVDAIVGLDGQDSAGCGEHRPGAARKFCLKHGSEHMCDCTGGFGRNVCSTPCSCRQTRKIRIVKPFLGVCLCNADCMDPANRAVEAPAGQVVPPRSRNGDAG